MVILPYWQLQSAWGLYCSWVATSPMASPGLPLKLSSCHMVPGFKIFPSSLQCGACTAPEASPSPVDSAGLSRCQASSGFQVGLLVWCTVLATCGRKLGVDPQETLDKNISLNAALNLLTTDYSVPAVKKCRLLKILNGLYRTFMEISQFPPKLCSSHVSIFVTPVILSSHKSSLISDHSTAFLDNNSKLPPQSPPKITWHHYFHLTNKLNIMCSFLRVLSLNTLFSLEVICWWCLPNVS